MSSLPLYWYLIYISRNPRICTLFLNADNKPLTYALAAQQRRWHFIFYTFTPLPGGLFLALTKIILQIHGENTNTGYGTNIFRSCQNLKYFAFRQRKMVGTYGMSQKRKIYKILNNAKKNLQIFIRGRIVFLVVIKCGSLRLFLFVMLFVAWAGKACLELAAVVYTLLFYLTQPSLARHGATCYLLLDLGNKL